MSKRLVMDVSLEDFIKVLRYVQNEGRMSEYDVEQFIKIRQSYELAKQTPLYKLIERLAQVTVNCYDLALCIEMIEEHDNLSRCRNIYIDSRAKNNTGKYDL